MDLLENRKQPPNDDLLKKRFIGKILGEESRDLNQAQIKLMSSRGFSSPQFFSDRGFKVIDDHKLQYNHPMVLRFIDMKTRTSKQGTKRKRSVPIHNKPLYGMVNNSLRRMSFEYTDRVKSMLAKDYNISI